MAFKMSKTTSKRRFIKTRLQAIVRFQTCSADCFGFHELLSNCHRRTNPQKAFLVLRSTKMPQMMPRRDIFKDNFSSSPKEEEKNHQKLVSN
ncbi:hypothetical protein TNCT_488891 [Trichonephila clavata]|uniref:Uncharacterized protein n=1 Tax=Trichonephila clavata TaxID=2740835 RepID=A0A8X6HV41_TRICU|nr:hypothetical protein TNCT_488891 [Trichonephila clavata]